MHFPETARRARFLSNKPERGVGDPGRIDVQDSRCGVLLSGGRVFPSYLQAGPSFFIEKSKRKMIAEDITAALAFVG